MRGALSTVVSCVLSIGIIPARAGSTMRYLGIDRIPEDHPRSCGEHFSEIFGESR